MDDGMLAEYLSVGMCYGKNEDFDILLRSMGYPGWSDNNCRNLLRDFISVNCSMSKTKGFLQINLENNRRLEELKHIGKIFYVNLNSYNYQ